MAYSMHRAPLTPALRTSAFIYLYYTVMFETVLKNLPRWACSQWVFCVCPSWHRRAAQCGTSWFSARERGGV